MVWTVPLIISIACSFPGRRRTFDRPPVDEFGILWYSFWAAQPIRMGDVLGASLFLWGEMPRLTETICIRKNGRRMTCGRLRFSMRSGLPAAAPAVAALLLQIAQLGELAVRGLHELAQPVLKVSGFLGCGPGREASGAGRSAGTGSPSCTSGASALSARGAGRGIAHLLNGQVDSGWPGRCR